MNKELQININFEDGSYIAKYNSKNTSNQKAIECLKDVLNHFTNRPTWFDFEKMEYKISEKDKKFIDYVENKIKELEKDER